MHLQRGHIDVLKEGGKEGRERGREEGRKEGRKEDERMSSWAQPTYIGAGW